MRYLALIILMVAGLAGCGGGAETPTVNARRGAISESFTEPARTRLEVRHRIGMPLQANVARIALKPGDRVTQGQLLIEPDTVPFRTAVREAEATLARLTAQLGMMRDNSVEEAELRNAEAMAEAAVASVATETLRIEELKLREIRLAKELERLSTLQRDSAAADRELDDARLNADAAAIATKQGATNVDQLRAMAESSRFQAEAIRSRIARKDFEIEALEQQVSQAEAALENARHQLELVQVKSPVDGIVLERFELGGGPISAGAPLMLVGTLEELEVEADVLTQDAYRLAIGAVVEYTVSSGAEPLRGTVTRIDPAGFTKFSSLGVEQQRVIVISSLEQRPENLGLGYRLLARYTKGTKQDAIIVPRSTILEDPDGTRYVFKVEGGRAIRATVELGLRSDFEVEIAKGLAENDVVVLAPDSTTQAGMRIAH